MTNGDIDVGEAALRAYVNKIEGWKAAFVPEQACRDGAIDVIRAWDAMPQPLPTPDAQEIGYAACGSALMAAITNAGYGSDVTAEECMAGATAVVTAVVAARRAATQASDTP